MKAHAIYISSRWPWPPRSGRDMMIRQSLKSLAEEFSITYVLVGAEANITEPALDVEDVVVLSRPDALEIAWNFISMPRLSLQERLFFSRRNFRAITDLCRAKCPAAVIVDMIRMSPYLYADEAHAGSLKICDMDDLLSKRYRQLANFKEHAVNPFGTFGHDPLFRVLGKLAEPMIESVFRIEACLIERREIDIGLLADLVLLVSPTEASELSAKTGRATGVMAFPPSMPVPKLIHANEKSRSGVEPATVELVTLLFIGDLRTPANMLAMNFILDEIFPELESAQIRYQMIVAGRAGVDLCQKFDATPYVNHLGWVDDLSDVYAAADIVLCPFVVGTGVKLKVLEAMAHAKPVVTNSIGAQGLSVQAGSHIVIAEGREGIARAIADLAGNRELRRRIGDAAAAFVAEHHDPMRLRKKLKETVRQRLHASPLPEFAQVEMLRGGC